MMLRFHTQTAGSSLTAQQPLNNVVRTTVQALAAVLGGTQSLHTNGFDEALGLPTEQSASLALRTQQILAEESGIAASADPLGGSYLIESWTAAIEREVNLRLEKIDAMGGMLAAIEAGYPQGEIETSAYRAQQAIERGETVVVGVNKFHEVDDTTPPVHSINAGVEMARVEALAQHRLRRAQGGRGLNCQEELAKLAEVARGEENLMPQIVQCVREDATLGEISDALRGVFGEYRQAG
jgi:methylmalonyl-CoA mutase N-terminal domain/subunit